MSKLKIYGMARTRAFRALWVAMELGIEYEHIPVEIGDAGARTPEFLAINPNGRLPVIVDGNFVLFESLAITMYLAKKHGAGSLYPATIEGEALVAQWSLWAVTEVDRGVNIWSLHAVRLPPEEQDLAKRAEALKVLVAPFKVLDTAVSKQPYLLGNNFTVADLNVAAVITDGTGFTLTVTPGNATGLGSPTVGNAAAASAGGLRMIAEYRAAGADRLLDQPGEGEERGAAVDAAV